MQLPSGKTFERTADFYVDPKMINSHKQYYSYLNYMEQQCCTTWLNFIKLHVERELGITVTFALTFARVWHNTDFRTSSLSLLSYHI